MYFGGTIKYKANVHHSNIFLFTSNWNNVNINLYREYMHTFDLTIVTVKNNVLLSFCQLVSDPCVSVCMTSSTAGCRSGRTGDRAGGSRQLAWHLTSRFWQWYVGRGLLWGVHQVTPSAAASSTIFFTLFLFLIHLARDAEVVHLRFDMISLEFNGILAFLAVVLRCIFRYADAIQTPEGRYADVMQYGKITVRFRRASVSTSKVRWLSDKLPRSVRYENVVLLDVLSKEKNLKKTNSQL